MKKSLKISFLFISVFSLFFIPIISSCSINKSINSNMIESNSESAKFELGSIFSLKDYKKDFSLLDLTDIKKQDISKFQSVHEINNKSTFIGKFNEQRNFYNSISSQFHGGIDIFMKEDTPVYTPYDSYVHKNILNYTESPDSQNTLGGVLILKIFLKDIKNISEDKKEIIITGIKKGLKKDEISSEEMFIYCLIYHLDNYSIFQTMKHSVYKNDFWLENKKYGASKYNEPSLGQEKDIYKDFKIPAGQEVGYVGNSSMNGGWSPHIHLQYVYPHVLNKRTWAPGVFSSQKSVLSNCIDPMYFYNYKLNSKEYKLNVVK
jgi:hypothetical protein